MQALKKVVVEVERKGWLTSVEANQCINMFLSGVTKYTDIASKLGLPYKSVNVFMTKWKSKKGILKTRNRKKNKATLLKEHKQLVAAPLLKLIENTVIEIEELTFLRNFYLTHI